MGGEQSKSDGTQNTLLSEPWRDINWGHNKDVLQFVKNYKPQAEGQQLRILLHGPVGAGKSSFINSVDSILKGRMAIQALVDNTSYDSFTKKYTTFRIPKGGPKSFYPFIFNDIMGLDPSRGVLVDDLKLALMGHIKDGYVFNPECKMSKDSQYYNSCPTDNDKVHVLVCVVPVDTISAMSNEIVRKMRKIRLEARDLGIPQVAILTKIDMACPEMKQLKNVYKARYVKQKMEQFSVNVGIPMNCIFPVKNYDSEIYLNDEVNALILNVLKNIINFGDDFINFQKE